MRTLPLSVVVLAISCGPAPQPDLAADIGGACHDSLDCKKGLWCEDAMPGGYCTNSCARNGQCVGDSMCIDMNGRGGMCAEECVTPGKQSNCRDGYTCFAVKDEVKGVCFPDGTTFSYPSPPPPPPPKAPIGAACAADSACGSGACYSPANGWPGGYCSKACGASNGCGLDAVCLTDTNSCVAVCSAPGTKSTCRDGYVCRGFSNRTDGFCTPAPKSTTGAACSSGSTCSDGTCTSNWPGGYCTRTCNFGSDCASGVCLDDRNRGSLYCVATCPSPGFQSTCRSGYVCSPFAAPRTDGYCEPAPINSGAGGGGGGGGGSGGGGSGSGSAPTVLNFTVSGFTGSWSGNAVNVVSATRTDTLAMNTCTFTQPAPGNVGGYVGLYGSTYVLSVRGTSTCPAGNATSTAAASCTSQTINTPMTEAELTLEVTGWTDDAPVIFKMRYPPHGLPGCNYANVIMDASNQWGIQGSTTVGKFRAGQPFDVRLVGAKALSSGSKSSDVSWDFTLKLQPN